MKPDMEVVKGLLEELKRDAEERIAALEADLVALVKECDQLTNLVETTNKELQKWKTRNSTPLKRTH